MTNTDVIDTRAISTNTDTRECRDSETGTDTVVFHTTKALAHVHTSTDPCRGINAGVNTVIEGDVISMSLRAATVDSGTTVTDLIKYSDKGLGTAAQELVHRGMVGLLNVFRNIIITYELFLCVIQ